MSVAFRFAAAADFLKCLRKLGLEDQEAFQEPCILALRKTASHCHGVAPSDNGSVEDAQSRFVRFVEDGKKVSDLCKLFRSQDLGRLKLRASGGLLYDDGLEIQPKADIISLQPPSISLATILKSPSLSGDIQRKLLLSFLLAKSVWEFYDSDWLAEAWSKNEVHFMRQRVDRLQDKIILNYRPYISAEFGEEIATPNGSTIQKRSHIYPKILALGITLLEIELGEPLEDHITVDYLDSNGQPRVNADHMVAATFIQSERWKSRKRVYLPIRRAIEICVKPDGSKLGTDPSRVREKLYSSVVAPLGEFFVSAFDCDGCPENFDPGPMELEAKDNDALRRDGTREVVFESVQALGASQPAETFITLPPLGSTLQGNSDDEREDCELFGNENPEPQTEGQKRQTDQWIKSFKLLRLKHKIGTGNTKRIKIAILDTGIDMNHSLIHRDRGRIVERESFLDTEVTSDASGHGTHIAGILLDLTTNTDLYIAKFTESRGYGINEGDSVRERVVRVSKVLESLLTDSTNVLEGSTTCKGRLEGGHDISVFGYNKAGARDKVRMEIKKCLNDNIVVFASASNDGGNRPRTYPGKYDRVLCIHSAAGNGDGSSFSPTPETGAIGHNFSAVGESVRSSWWSKDSDRHDTYRYMSGTSFATPIAVSVAVFMVGYIERHLPHYEWNIEPLSPEGIRTLFIMISRENKRDGYDWISPQWFFHKHREGKIQQDLIEELDGHAIA